jgi:hypothetical protein
MNVQRFSPSPRPRGVAGRSANPRSAMDLLRRPGRRELVLLNSPIATADLMATSTCRRRQPALPSRNAARPLELAAVQAGG